VLTNGQRRLCEKLEAQGEGGRTGSVANWGTLALGLVLLALAATAGPTGAYGRLALAASGGLAVGGALTMLLRADERRALLALYRAWRKGL
jgi:hypothetical protein